MALAFAMAAAGCETSGSQVCDTSIMGNPAQTFAGGRTEGDVYQSSPWDGELLSFPGGMIYDVEHHLVDAAGQPAVPRWVSLWVSLSKDGDTDGSPVARATGNEAVVLQVGPTTITVQNDGCQAYWLLVAAGTGPSQPSPP